MLFGVVGTASAGAAARHDRIQRRIQQVVENQAPGHRAHVGSLNALTQMKPCHAPLQMRLYGQGTYRNMRVSCPDQGWQLYVPVTLTSLARIAVAAHDLPAGTPLTKSDLKLVRSSAGQGDSHQVAHSLKSALGKTLTAPVSAGTPIRLSSLAQPVRIHAGQQVTVHVRSEAVSVEATAIALQQGRVGQSILVKNPSSGKRYRVEVTSHGVIDNLSG
ncbi:flagellar basal body P-ring formation chaperone FlgA [Salinisphaera sp. RV14]|uniref:flagellar basal body P-ring formation chaperone FlgA n=1 Tax=unclassified Salinisphaera TaxID=2649847 RepID=UPI003F877E58